MLNNVKQLIRQRLPEAALRPTSSMPYTGSKTSSFTGKRCRATALTKAPGRDPPVWCPVLPTEQERNAREGVNCLMLLNAAVTRRPTQETIKRPTQSPHHTQSPPTPHHTTHPPQPEQATLKQLAVTITTAETTPPAEKPTHLPTPYLGTPEGTLSPASPHGHSPRRLSGLPPPSRRPLPGGHYPARHRRPAPLQAARGSPGGSGPGVGPGRAPLRPRSPPAPALRRLLNVGSRPGGRVEVAGS